jgi:hypothetical protein
MFAVSAIVAFGKSLFSFTHFHLPYLTCHPIAHNCVVFEGGLLFLYYLEVMESSSASRRIKAELKSHQFECKVNHLQHDEEALPANVMSAFIDDHGVKFATWLIQAASRVGEGCKKQLWYHTFVSSR